MLHRLLILIASAAALAVAVVPTASAETVLAVDIDATHTVVWDAVEGGYPDECKGWSKSSGTQTLRVHSDRRELMRLERVFQSTLLTSKRPGTFAGSVNRVGRWKTHAVPATTQCTGCGPNSELGPCTPTPPPPPPAFTCGERDVRGPLAVIGYQKTSGIPSISSGLTAKVWGRFDDAFPNCPPTLPRGMRSRSFKSPSPDWERLPQSDLARLTKLQPGDSVTAEVKRQRSYVEQGGRTTKGDDCIKAPDVTDGYGECAVTEYHVTFTRME